MFSLELPQQGDSNEYTQYTIFNIEKKITINYPKSGKQAISVREAIEVLLYMVYMYIIVWCYYCVEYESLAEYLYVFSRNIPVLRIHIYSKIFYLLFFYDQINFCETFPDILTLI